MDSGNEEAASATSSPTKLRINLTSPTFDDDSIVGGSGGDGSGPAPSSSSNGGASAKGRGGDVGSQGRGGRGGLHQRQGSSDSALGESAVTSPDMAAVKKMTVCSSDRSSEENFESYGENDDVDYDNSVDSPDYVYILNRTSGGGGDQNAEPPAAGISFDDDDASAAADAVDGNGASRMSTAAPASAASAVSQQQQEEAFRRASPQRNSIRRNAWMRSSLRRTPNRPKRVGSNALASALYHNAAAGGASFNSSGRSSNCDEGDMQSDISLEEDVNDLNAKVQQLQEQVGHLAESQATTDDRYSKVKQENQLLTQKIHMLEETIREVEIRSEERLESEQKRNREALARLEREKQLEVENYAIRLAGLEKEHGKLEYEAQQLRQQADRLKAEKEELEDQLQESKFNLTTAQDKVSKLEEVARKEAERADQERHSSAQLIQELSREVEELREQAAAATATSRRTLNGSSNGVNGRSFSMESDCDVNGGTSDVTQGAAVINGHRPDDDRSGSGNGAMDRSELSTEIRKLREENKRLSERCEEMQAMSMLNRGLEQGKNLLSTVDAAPSSSMSIADELGGMSDFQDMSFGSMSDELDQVKRALKEQQEVNGHLRSYIDGILMNIMEKYPELLEVRK